jgi:metal-responsive CopG/Arc/MetJ family transcriptional regulator
MDENLLNAVDRAAEAAGQSRSAFLADAARQRVRG